MEQTMLLQACSSADHFRIIWSVSGSQMQEGARFYLKNVKIEQFK
jgi:hypothetical protein